MQRVVVSADTILEYDHVVVAPFRVARRRFDAAVSGHAGEHNCAHLSRFEYVV